MNLTDAQAEVSIRNKLLNSPFTDLIINNQTLISSTCSAQWFYSKPTHLETF